jgi:transposase
MNYTHFIGIDVSKLWLDFAVVHQNQLLFHLRTENSIAGVQSFVKQLKKAISDYDLNTYIFCMEHTGIYNNHLLNYLYKKQANIWLESGLHIKQSSGLQRGKNDKVDAKRIAMYAYKNRDEVKLWKPRRDVVEQLKHLTVLRTRLVNVSKQIKTPLKESGSFISKKINYTSTQLCKNTIKSVQKDLEAVEQKIQLVIKSYPELNRLFNIITSIVGIGPVTATEIIITTNEFKDISCAKKFACYSGVAPYDYGSGTSIRGKTRVSHMANKNIKTLLHMAALVATSFNQEMKTYYERKAAEGKNKMLILNAVRNKLVLRIFACVKQNRMFINNYQYSLV